MGIIKVLPAEIAGRIAAGEVIDRPASVVKELVENSIDAGATRIRVITEQGGQRLIQVIDNGCGMDRQDAMMCLEAHATSKISQEGDVGQIHTLGFRGEAVPSVASVSKFQIQTRRADDLEGTDVIVNYGAIEAVNDCGCAPGTNIRVNYLFGNLPARRKFLKGPNTEDAHIEETMLLLALSRPDIAFELTMNGRNVLRSSSAHDIAARAVMLLGKENFETMLPVNYTEDGIHVYGYISKPGFTRNSRHDQRLIINGRAASAETIYYALREAYDTLILKGRYPSAVLYIDLQPDRVDVNVHPAKREVRFRDPLRVSAIVAAAIRRGLRQMPGGAELAIPCHQHTPNIGQLEAVGPVQQSAFPLQEIPECIPGKAELMAEPSQVSELPAVPGIALEVERVIQPAAGAASPASPAPLPPKPAAFTPKPIQQRLNFASPPKMSDGAQRADTTPRPEGPSSPSEQPSAVSNGDMPFALKGRLGKRYMLAESGSGLVIVDIKAARQRILFERFLKNLNTENSARQPLLMPVTLSLSPDEARFLKGEMEHFDALGFGLEPFGGHSFLITAIPVALPGDQDLETTIRDIIDDLRRNRVTNRQNAVHLAQVAARYGISKSEELSEAEMRSILRELAKCDMPYACPNGQPTMLHFTFAELERRFKNN